MIKIELEPQRYKDIPGVAEKHTVSTTVLSMYSKHAGHVCRMKVSYIGKDGCGRREYMGEILPGPYAAMVPLGTVIDNHGGSGAESRRLRDAGLEYDVEDGDRVEIDGLVYEIRDDKWLHYPQFYLVES